MVRQRDLTSPVALPAVGLTVPVVAPGGGVGRSSVAALMAQCFAADARTAVVDTCHPNASPWRSWVTRPATRPAGWSAGADRQALLDSCAAMATGAGAVIDVLADTAPRPVGACQPVVVEAWRDLGSLLGHRVVIADTGTALLSDSFGAQADPASAGQWLALPDVVPVLVVPASPAGVDDALVVATMLEDAGLLTHRLTVAVVGIVAKPFPRRVLAGLTLLAPRVARVVRIPHDRRIRMTGRPRLDQAATPVRRAVRELACSLAAVADSEPLGSAATGSGGAVVERRP